MNNVMRNNGLPAHASLLAGEGVWLEGSATEQFGKAARLEGCVRAVGMPDLHPGIGIPIGAALAFSDRINPRLIGSDIGCGVRFVATSVKRQSIDRIERRLRKAFCTSRSSSEDGKEISRLLLNEGVFGLSRYEGFPEAVRQLASMEKKDPPIADKEIDESYFPFLSSIGTIGSGNHFAEISFVEKISDEAAAKQLGLHPGKLAVLVHSGSRYLGRAVADKWNSRELFDNAMKAYLIDQEFACRFARANRFFLGYRLLSAVNAARPAKSVFASDHIHNQVSKEAIDGKPIWLHRKGVSPAHKDSAVIILGSRGSSSWIMKGTGSKVGLNSVAHGAGRRMTRSEAHTKMKSKYRRKSLLRTSLGSRVICDRTELLYQEHPDAYKPMKPVIETLIEAGLATPIAQLTPLVTVK